jgi:hypothetical protein
LWLAVDNLPRFNSLGCAIDNLAILDEPLNQPVAFTSTEDPKIDTCLAQVEIPVVTNATMVVDIWNRLVAVVAVNAE